MSGPEQKSEWLAVGEGNLPDPGEWVVGSCKVRRVVDDNLHQWWWETEHGLQTECAHYKELPK